MVVSYVMTIVVALVIINVTVHTMFIRWSLTKREEIMMAYARSLEYVASNEGMYDNIELQDQVDEAAYKSGSQVVIAGKDGDVIESSGNKTDWEKIGRSGAVANAFNGQEIAGEYSDHGEITLLYVAAPIMQNSNVIGVVFLSSVIDDIYYVAEDMSKNLMSVSIVLLLLLALIIYIMVDGITSPLQRITKAIESMDRGTLKQHVVVTGSDEIARLGNAFNQMNSKVTMIDQQRRTFLADASHELKSPLAGIKVLVQALINGGLEDKRIATEFLSDVDKEIDRLSKIVANLLELTRLEGEYGVQTERFELGLLCTEVADKLSFKAEHKHIQVDVDTIPILVEGNREQILRVIYNILDNAIKYSPEESSIHLWLEEGHMARVHVSDQGYGIGEKDLPRIFERFYRVDKARDRKTGGSGLGLPIAREIVRNHGGDISVTSVIEKGTTFTIYLPFSQTGRGIKDI